ncbi:E3 ubiquitin-protein ligase Topors [Spatholobus suberectus]|nr:E3 ubiquitin-protein ligase Topors [Spatholobus suberectus]
MEDDAAIGVSKHVSPDSEDSNCCCPICLGPFVQLCYLDKCFHKFCFNCILRWTKVVAGKHPCPPSSVKCPLCKTENFSIIYGVDGSCFRQHYVNEDFEDSFILSRAHRCRLQCYYTEQGFLDDIFNISLYWKSHKYNQPNCWLESWLRREIQALIQEEDVDVIVHHILGVIKAALWTRREQKSLMNAPEKKQEEFKISVSDAARPFLAARTDRFVYEIQLFLASGMNIEAYDAVYIQRLGWSSPGINTEVSQSELIDRTTVIPYLYIFDGDSDENE